MKNFAKYVLLGIAITLVTLVGIGLFQDNSVRVSKDISVSVSPEQVEHYLSDISELTNWFTVLKDSPLEKTVEQNAIRVFEQGKEIWSLVRLPKKPNSETGYNAFSFEISNVDQPPVLLTFEVVENTPDASILQGTYRSELAFVMKLFKKMMIPAIETQLEVELKSAKHYFEANKP